MSLYPKNLSIVIPCFNEQKRLRRAILSCQKFSHRFPGWEFIFVNDGSTDKTKALIQATNFKLISYQPNRGKGFALKQGVKAATKPEVLISDVDLSVSLTEIPRLNIGCEIAIGSRKAKGAKVVKHQSCGREWLGCRFTDLSKLWLGLTVADVTCGFKLFKAPVAKKLFSLSKINRWGYDAEILFLAKKLGYRVVEIPIIWQNDTRTKVSLMKDIFRSCYDLWLIRWNDWWGKYH